jgi:hypothetical protein
MLKSMLRLAQPHTNRTEASLARTTGPEIPSHDYRARVRVRDRRT